MKKKLTKKFLQIMTNTYEVTNKNTSKIVYKNLPNKQNIYSFLLQCLNDLSGRMYRCVH